MFWLVTHMWLALGAAALFGLLLGWAVRGLLLNGKARKAVVDRDVARVELEQSRREIDQLYAAQNKQSQTDNEIDDQGLRLELEQREAKLQSLSSELASAHEELDELKKKAIAAAAITGSAGIATAVIATQSETDDKVPPPLDAGIISEDASLEWKNRYLASRVRRLEANASNAEIEDQPVEQDGLDGDELGAALSRAQEAEAALELLKAEAEDDKKKSIAAALATAAAAGVGGAALAKRDTVDIIDETVDGHTASSDKHAWQSYYLRQRLAATDPSNVDALPLVRRANEQVDVAPLPTIDVDDQLENPDVQSDANPVDDRAQASSEISYWRKNNLEQSLAYLEDNPIADRRTLYGEGKESGSEAIELHDKEAAAIEPAEAVGEPSLDEASAGELEQELARLRWRNRYLEGRLAYVSGETPAADAMPDEPSVKPLETPADALLAAMDSVEEKSNVQESAGRPDASHQPEADGDDLTRIEGVDDGISGNLNAIGIWHYHQIASWTPENVAWVDAELGLAGAVQKQNWIVQAGALSLGTDLSVDS